MKQPLHIPHMRGDTLLARWTQRVQEGIEHQSFSSQVAQYRAHSTTRDYVWNTLGQASAGLLFPLLVILVTRVCGTAVAGQVSFAFVLATLLQFICTYGMRTLQVSDTDEHNSFAAYQLHRGLTSLVMFACAWAFLFARAYDTNMVTLCWSLIVFKLVDGIADVYEGRLQQYDKLYLAGISQSIRHALSFSIFSLMLLITRSAQLASITLAIASLITLLFVSIPLTKFETPQTRAAEKLEIRELFLDAAPAFLGQFLFALIDAIPKFGIEAYLPSSQQLYFNALYFPAMAIVLVAGLIYKPQLTRLSFLWNEDKNIRSFTLKTAQLAFVILVVSGIGIYTFYRWGADINQVLYGVSFHHLVAEQVLMICAGFLSALVDMTFSMLCLMRKQAQAYNAYLIALATGIVASIVLISTTHLTGAVWAYLISMGILASLLLVRYVRALLN